MAAKKFETEAGDIGIRKYSGDKMAKTGNIAVAVLSSVLPTLAILVLYFVNRMIVRIGLIILFTALFSVTLAVFTAARKVEIFSATAAYVIYNIISFHIHLILSLDSPLLRSCLLELLRIVARLDRRGPSCRYCSFVWLDIYHDSKKKASALMSEDITEV